MLPHSTGVLLMRAMLLGLVTIAAVTVQKTADFIIARLATRRGRIVLAGAALAVTAAAIFALTWTGEAKSATGETTPPAASDKQTAPPADPDSVNLTDGQLKAVKVEPIEARDFPDEKD